MQQDKNLIATEKFPKPENHNTVKIPYQSVSSLIRTTIPHPRPSQ